MAKDRRDFVKVKLSAAGEAHASGRLQIANPRSDFEFKPGDVVEVTRAYDWNQFLSQEKTPGGEPLFELVVDEAEEA